MTDQLLYALLYTHLDDAALGAGAGAYSLVAQHLSGWFTDQRRWVDALYEAWVADPEHGATNQAALGGVAGRPCPPAVAALAPVAARADGLVAGRCRAALAAASRMRSRPAWPRRHHS